MIRVRSEIRLNSHLLLLCHVNGTSKILGVYLLTIQKTFLDPDQNYAEAYSNFLVDLIFMRTGAITVIKY